MTQHDATSSAAAPHDTWRHLLRGAGGTYAMRIVGSGVNVITGLLLARWLGAAEFGVFMYAVSWASILLVPAKLGAESLVVREVAAAGRRRDWSMMRGIARWMTGAVVIASVVVCAVTSAVFLALRGLVDRDLTVALHWALPLVPLMALALIFRSIMEGLGRVVRAQVHELLVQPLLFLALILTVRSFAPTRLDALGAVALVGINLAVVLVVAFTRMVRTLPAETRSARATYDARRWIGAALPLVLLGSAIVLNMRLDVVMLGLLAGKSDAGVYSIASMAAGLIALLPVAASTALGPHLARLHAGDGVASVQRMLTRLTRLLLVAVVIASGIMIALAPWGFGLVGPEYPRAVPALAILCGAQLVSVLAGPVGIILVMTGHERDAAFGFAIGAAVNAGLNLVLIPRFGLEAAACATLISNGVWNLILIRRVRRHVGLESSVIGARTGG